MPRGCLIVQAGLACGKADHGIVDLLAACRDEYRKDILDRFERP